MDQPRYKTRELMAIPRLLDWIDPSNLGKNRLFYNPGAIHLAESYIRQLSFHCNPLIDYSIDFGNPLDMKSSHQHLLKKYADIFGYDIVAKVCDDVQFLRENIHKMQPLDLSYNVHAIPLLEENTIDFEWHALSLNIGARRILLNNLGKIDWSVICMNTGAIDIIESNPGMIDWWQLSGNHAAIKILEANLDKVEWTELSNHSSMWEFANKYAPVEHDIRMQYREYYTPERIATMDDNQISSACDFISHQPWAIDFLTANKFHIDYYELSVNPAIFTTDYTTPSRKRMELIRDELLSVALRPERVAAWRAAGVDLDSV